MSSCTFTNVCLWADNHLLNEAENLTKFSTYKCFHMFKILYSYCKMLIKLCDGWFRDIKLRQIMQL